MGEQDLLALLDELEGYLSEAARIPLTGRLMISEQEIYEIIDRLRQSIPEALLAAQKLNRERDRLLQQARDDGEALIAESRSFAEKLTRESAITQRAQQEADRIVEDARRVSREIRLAARDYADELLSRVEDSVQRTLTLVRAGREELGMGQGVSAAGGEDAAAAAEPRMEPVASRPDSGRGAR